MLQQSGLAFRGQSEPMLSGPRWCAMAQSPLTDDLKQIGAYVKEADDTDIIAGPDELYAMVAELWPDHLHKIKPPRRLMH